MKEEKQRAELWVLQPSPIVFLKTFQIAIERERARAAVFLEIRLRDS